MNAEIANKLHQAAKGYIRENRDTMEIFELIVPFESIPEGEEDPEDWAVQNGPEIDDSIGFTIVPISFDGANGFALLTVKGSSWEGTRIFTEGVFSNMAEARSHAGKLGILC
jgi:hypothetical protein